MIHWDSSVNLGTVLGVLGVLVTFWRFQVKNVERAAKFGELTRSSIRELSFKIDEIKEQVKDMPQMQTRMDMMWTWFIRTGGNPPCPPDDTRNH